MVKGFLKDYDYRATERVEEFSTRDTLNNNEFEVFGPEGLGN